MPRLASHGAVAARGHGGQNRYNREPWRDVSYDDRRVAAALQPARRRGRR